MTKYLLRRFVSYAILTALATVFAYIAASSFFRPRNRYEGIQPPISESSIDAILSDYGVNEKTRCCCAPGNGSNGSSPPAPPKLGQDLTNKWVLPEMLGDPVGSSSGSRGGWAAPA